MPDKSPNPGSSAASPQQDPPPVKRGPGKPLAVIASTVIVAGLLLLVVINIDRSGKPDNVPTGRDAPNMGGPGALTAEELAGESAATDFSQPSGGGLPEGGWIQFTDPDDPERLAQRYRFDSLDPNPAGRGAGWLELTGPNIEIYLADDRMLSIMGDSALVSAPNDALEEGSITGNVAIRLFETTQGRPINPQSDLPTFMIQTGEAEFDNLLGEVRCENRILVETPAMEFPGENLRMQIDDLNDWVTLRIDTVDYIRLASNPVSPPDGAQSDSGSRYARQRDESSPGSGRSSRPAPPAHRPAAPSSAFALASFQQSDDPQYYRLRLSDNIRIEQGDELTGRIITGQRIDVIFSAKGGGLGLNIAAAATMPGPIRTLPETISHLILASMSPDDRPQRRLSPPATDGDAYVYCDGPLTLDPIQKPAGRLPEPGDTLLELTGNPVKLRDRQSDTSAQCAWIRYRTRTRTTELIGSDEHSLLVTSPEMDVRADSFWIRQSDNTGGFEGPGTLVASMSGDAGQSGDGAAIDPKDDLDNLSVDWRERVELTFHPQAKAETFALGDLRSASFIGDVAVAGREFDVTAEQVGLRLPPDASGTSGIEAISASGGVQVTGVGDTGSLTCEDLDVQLAVDDEGRSLPTLLVASGGVRAENPGQSIDAQDLEVTFIPAPEGSVDSPEPGGNMLARTGEVIMDTLIARGDVDVALPDGARILADSLDIDQSAGNMELQGDNVSIASGRLLADRGRRILVRRSEKLARWQGAGRARVFPDDVGDNLAELPKTNDLQITWIGGVDFTLDTSDDGNADEVRIRDATFNNGVDVQAEEFWLDTDHLALRFPTGQAGASTPAGPEIAETIDNIRAWGNVRVGSRADRGSLACNDLDLALTRTAGGRSVPQQMVASGRVMASNLDRVSESGQRIWTDYLTVTFHTDEPSDSAVDSEAQSDEFDSFRARVKDVVALRNVQVEMAEGGRAFADQLFGDADRDIIELRGDDIVIVRDDLIIDRATLVSLRGQDNAASWEGPGRARVFESSVEPQGDGQVARPAIDESREPELYVNWSERMLYDNAFNDGAGSLHFRGDVQAMSQPSAVELNTMSGDALELQFVRRGEQATSGVASAIAASPAISGQGRKLATFIAKGDARLESRTWQTDDHLHTPDVFHVAGRHVEYDALTSQARVIGEGTLLIRDTDPASDRDQAGDAGTPADPVDAPPVVEPVQAIFSSRGITRFRWNQELRLTRTMDDRFELFLTGDVRAENQAANGDISTLRAERVDAVVAREEGPVAPPAEDRLGAADLFELGGPVAFQRVAASGGVAIITPTRDVRCDSFDYNLLTNLAEISAVEGQRVSVLTRGNARPIQAQHVLWYMAEDTIVITRGLASGSR